MPDFCVLRFSRLPPSKTNDAGGEVRKREKHRARVSGCVYFMQCRPACLYDANSKEGLGGGRATGPWREINLTSSPPVNSFLLATDELVNS